MPTKAGNITNIIESLAPKSYACKWDNVGLQLGSQNHNVEKLLITLEVTNEVLDEAIEKNIDMIVAHHPMIFSPLKNIIKEDFKGKFIYKAIQNNIDIYAAHTNIDIACGGLNDYLINKLNIVDTKVLDITDNESYAYSVGIGRVGKLDSPKTLNELIKEIKEKLNTSHLRIAGELTTNIKKVAVINGSGADLIKTAIYKNCDCVITGDVRYHDAQDAISQGINVIDIGHYDSEKFFVEFMTAYLKEEVNRKKLDVQIIPSNLDINPFKVI